MDQGFMKNLRRWSFCCHSCLERGDIPLTTKKGEWDLKIGVGSWSCGPKSTMAQIRRSRRVHRFEKALKFRYKNESRRFANSKTPPSWKRTAESGLICSTVGSLSVRRRMRSQARKTDFPDLVLDVWNGVERRGQTNARLSTNHKHVMFFAG